MRSEGFDHDPTMLCLHCNLRKINRPRNLCWPCYYSPIRNLYPAKGRKPNRGNGQSEGFATPEPTMALPGTPEKIEVLAQRIARGERLFHAQDARR